MIPKKIHYCWFGGKPLPALAKKCIKSWKKYCADYEIIEWNETNFDVNCCDYVREAYEAKKWAFVSDYARLYVLLKEGGIYLDTDVEVIKPLDGFLSQHAFSGFESSGQVPTGIIAAEKGHAFFQELLQDYKGIHFIKEDGTLDTTTNVVRITEKCLKYGLKMNNSMQSIAEMTFYPMDFFCPKDAVTRRLSLTENSTVIHHFDGSWMETDRKFVKKFTDIFGYEATKRMIRIKHAIRRKKD